MPGDASPLAGARGVLAPFPSLSRAAAGGASLVPEQLRTIKYITGSDCTIIVLDQRDCRVVGLLDNGAGWPQRWSVLARYIVVLTRRRVG